MKYFDAELARLAASLGKAIPDKPLINFVSASADERKLVILASGDTEPGRYYIFDRDKKQLNELLLVRPQLEHFALAKVQSVTYPTKDGVSIPAYLTLPVGSTGKGLPAIVMPHGGPSSRDEWGFDWLAQYFASRGYVVLQPNYRGSSGYGDDWYVNNGFKSWDVAIADIEAGGTWLIDQGIAKSDKLAIVGWSYGGYAALQSSAVNPTLYKAVVAIAPVTDLQMLIDDWSKWSSDSSVARDFVGRGKHVVEGSPRQRANQIIAPILMFSGDADVNVNIRHSRAMKEALLAAGKNVQLVEYPGLDHQLPDNDARTDMLQRADAFLRTSLKIDP